MSTRRFQFESHIAAPADEVSAHQRFRNMTPMRVVVTAPSRPGPRMK